MVSLRRAYTTLRPREREILLLYCRDGLTAHEIAERLGVAWNTVKTQLHTAHARLAVFDDKYDTAHAGQWSRRWAFQLGYETRRAEETRRGN